MVVGEVGQGIDLRPSIDFTITQTPTQPLKQMNQLALLRLFYFEFRVARLMAITITHHHPNCPHPHYYFHLRPLTLLLISCSYTFIF